MKDQYNKASARNRRVLALLFLRGHNRSHRADVFSVYL